MSESQGTTDPQQVDAEMERRRLDYQEMEESQYVLGRDVSGRADGSGGERDLRDFHSECPPTKHDLHPELPQEKFHRVQQATFRDMTQEEKDVYVAVQRGIHGKDWKPLFEYVETPFTEAEMLELDDQLAQMLDPLAGVEFDKQAKEAPEFEGTGVSDSFGDTAGFKFDKGKLRYDLIPMESMKALATILTLGAEKYADRNWEGGMSWQRVYASLMRHLVAFEAGEDTDPESGELHMAHALCNVVFLVTYQMRPSLADFDDRPTPEPVEIPPHWSQDPESPFVKAYQAANKAEDMGMHRQVNFVNRRETDPPLTKEEYESGGTPLYPPDYGYNPEAMRNAGSARA